MRRLITALAFLALIAAAPVLADTIEVRVDFENQALGPVDLLAGLEFVDAGTGLKVTFDRVSNIPTAPALPLEVVDLGDPSFGFGTRSLSPFLDTRANTFVGYLRITIDTSGLFGPATGLQALRIDWDMGDYVPSDNDDLFIASDTSAGTLDGFVEYDNGSYPPPFGSQTYTLIRTQDITQIRMFGGTGTTPEAPNSVFYDNFIFSLQTPGTWGAADETPISGLGGGGGPSGLGPTGGKPDGGTPTAPPIPEPGTIFAVAAGIAALGARARRKARDRR